MNILRKVFGPSRKEIWRQFCAQTGTTFVEGGFARTDKIEAAHGPWTVTLDTFAVSTGKSTIVYTRMRAPYVNPDSFRFDVYREGIFTEIGRWFGMQDVNVGFPEFDSEFVIKGNSEEKLRRLFSSQEIRRLISAQPNIRFCVKDDEGKFWGKNFPEGVDELYFQVVGVIKDIERLKLLFDLFAETLDELCRMGSAYEQAPPVKL
jgi:hypothetical protein